MQTTQDRAAQLKNALSGNPGPHQTAVIRSAIYLACEGTNLNPKHICEKYAPAGYTLTAEDIFQIENLADLLFSNNSQQIQDFTKP